MRDVTTCRRRFPFGYVISYAASLTNWPTGPRSTEQPTGQPTDVATDQPTGQPTGQLTEQSTTPPADVPAEQPTEQPTEQLSEQPTDVPARIILLYVCGELFKLQIHRADITAEHVLVCSLS